jgi:hypothetical protein
MAYIATRHVAYLGHTVYEFLPYVGKITHGHVAHVGNKAPTSRHAAFFGKKISGHMAHLGHSGCAALLHVARWGHTTLGHEAYF